MTLVDPSIGNRAIVEGLDDTCEIFAAPFQRHGVARFRLSLTTPGQLQLGYRLAEVEKRYRLVPVGRQRLIRMILRPAGALTDDRPGVRKGTSFTLSDCVKVRHRELRSRRFKPQDTLQG